MTALLAPSQTPPRALAVAHLAPSQSPPVSSQLPPRATEVAASSTQFFRCGFWPPCMPKRPYHPVSSAVTECVMFRFLNSSAPKNNKADDQSESAAVAVPLPPSAVAPPLAGAEGPLLTISAMKKELAEAKSDLSATETKLENAKNELTAAKNELATVKSNGDQSEIKRADEYVSLMQTGVAKLIETYNTAQDRVNQLTQSLSLAEAAARPRDSVIECDFQKAVILTLGDEYDDMRFVETARYKETLVSTRNQIEDVLGSRALRQLSFRAVTGPIGVGKTTFAEHLTFALANEFKALALTVRISALVSNLNRPLTDFTPDDLLAAAIFRAMFRGVHIPLGLTLKAIIGKMASAFGVKMVFINLDEFQMSISATRDILSAAMYTFSRGEEFHVFPIASGIWPVGATSALLKDSSDPRSESLVKEIDLSFAEFFNDAVALEDLYCSFLEFAGLPRGLRCDELRMAFDDCGGFGHIIRKLAVQIKRLHSSNQLQHLFSGRSPLLSYEEVSGIMEAVTTDLALNEYSMFRWHVIVRADGGEVIKDRSDVSQRDSWTQSTRVLLRRIVLCILTDRLVNLNERILPDDGGANSRLTSATYRHAIKSGLMGVYDQAGGDAKILVAPPTWVLIMSQHAGVLPLGAGDIIDPFKNDDHSHEKLALATLYFRLLAVQQFGDASLPIGRLRLGADKQGALIDDLTLAPSAEIPTLVFRTRFLDALSSEKLYLGQVQMAPKNQPGLDGWALFEGRLLGASVLILWLSQSKWRTAVVGSTGVAATSAVMRSSEARDYLELMVEPSEILLEQVMQMYPGRDVIRVFDIFTTHIGPVRGFNDLPLPERSVAFLTTSETFKSVVGRTFSVRQQAERTVPAT